MGALREAGSEAKEERGVGVGHTGEAAVHRAPLGEGGVAGQGGFWGVHCYSLVVM